MGNGDQMQKKAPQLQPDQRVYGTHLRPLVHQDNSIFSVTPLIIFVFACISLVMLYIYT